MSVDFSLTREEKNTLGSIALNAVSLRLRGEFPPEPELSRYSPTLRKNLGCFVTLKEKGRLRGCIGTIVGESPLVRNVWRMAQLAAFDDPRFPPVSPSEWDELSMEITVLGELSLCPDPKRIVIGRHGFVLSAHGRTGVFLPQVPVEQHWDLPAYLTNLCYKAGLPDGSWKAPGARLYWYEGLAFPVDR